MKSFNNLVNNIKSTYGDMVAISERIAREETLLHTVAVISFVSELTNILEGMKLNGLLPIVLIEESKKTFSTIPNFDFYFEDFDGNQFLDSYPDTPKIYSEYKEEISKVWKSFNAIAPNLDPLCIDFDVDSVLKIELTEDKATNVELLINKMLTKDQLMLLEKEKLELELNTPAPKTKKPKV